MVKCTSDRSAGGTRGGPGAAWTGTASARAPVRMPQTACARMINRLPRLGCSPSLALARTSIARRIRAAREPGASPGAASSGEIVASPRQALELGRGDRHRQAAEIGGGAEQQAIRRREAARPFEHSPDLVRFFDAGRLPIEQAQRELEGV